MLFVTDGFAEYRKGAKSILSRPSGHISIADMPFYINGGAYQERIVVYEYLRKKNS